MANEVELVGSLWLWRQVVFVWPAVRPIRYLQYYCITVLTSQCWRRHIFLAGGRLLCLTTDHTHVLIFTTYNTQHHIQPCCCRRRTINGTPQSCSITMTTNVTWRSLPPPTVHYRCNNQMMVMFEGGLLDMLQ